MGGASMPRRLLGEVPGQARRTAAQAARGYWRDMSSGPSSPESSGSSSRVLAFQVDPILGSAVLIFGAIGVVVVQLASPPGPPPDFEAR